MYNQALPVGLSLAAIALAQSDTAPPPGFTYGGNDLEVIRDNETVSEAFPDVPGIDLLSPYFLDPEGSNAGFANGTEGPTSQTELEYFVQTLANRNDWLTYRPADFLSEEGRSFPYLYLTEPAPSGMVANSTKLKVYIQASIHGNEPAADQGALALLGKMDANQTWTASILERMDIMMLPRWNPDGVSYFQRNMANNLDPNREAAKLDSPQSRDIWRRLHQFDPDVMVDMHEYTASTTFGEDAEYQHAADAMLGVGTDLNIHEDIIDQGNNIFLPAIAAKLEAYDLRTTLYVTGPANVTPPVFTQWSTGARFADSNVALGQSVAFLLETRGIRLADQHFQRRVATQLLKLEAVLETARDNEGLKDLIENARQEFIDSTEDIVITDATETINTTYPLVQRSDGAVVDVPVTFIRRPTLANLTRSRPEAYLIPRTWSSIVERLEIFGLEIETLDYEYRGTVEALTIATSELDSEIYEGHVLNTVTTTTVEREVHLPAGSFLVSTRQKNAARAFAVLEPEGLDSYVTWNFVPLAVNDEYPIFRVMA